MPISSISQVFLRLFALGWLVAGTVQLAVIPSMGFTGIPMVITAAFPFLAGIAVWFAAPFLSRLIARGNDSQVTLQGVTLRQLYSTTFIGVGLYFALTSFARTFSWAHYFVVRNSGQAPFVNTAASSYYELAEPVITLAAAIFLVVTSDTWARRLAKKHSEEQTPAAGTP